MRYWLWVNAVMSSPRWPRKKVSRHLQKKKSSGRWVEHYCWRSFTSETTFMMLMPSPGTDFGLALSTYFNGMFVKIIGAL